MTRNGLLFAIGITVSATAHAATRVDNMDGTYSYDVAIAYNGPTTKYDGPLTLDHVGPARYSWNPQPFDNNTEYVDNGSIDQPLNPINGLVGGRVIDSNHVEWEITHVNGQLLATERAAYFAQFSEVEGTGNALTPAGVVGPMFDAQAGLEEEPGSYVLNSYAKNTCGSGSSKAKQWVWSSGTVDRITSSTEFVTGETSAIVTLDVPLGTCSGVLIDDNRVLTAAHCVFDADTGSAIDEGIVSVCQYNGYDSGTRCSSVVDIRIFGSYLAHQKTKFDWAVLWTNLDLGAEGKSMALSQASDSRLSDIVTIDDYRLAGVPSIPDGGSCSGNTDIHLSENGDLDEINSRTLQIDLTHADGDSGGAHYYDGSTPGGTWYVYAVHMGHWWTPTNQAAKGPKVPFYVDSILALM